jgi:hypothetical protein
MKSERWRWRGSVALVAVALGFVIYPLIEGGNDVINSDWPAFATGGRLIVEDPGHLYNFDTQRRVELEVTGGRSLITLGIQGILPFLAPAWVAFLAAPFALLGTDLGGRLWILCGLAALALGLYLAVRPRPPNADPTRAMRGLPAERKGARAGLSPALPAFASVPTALLLLNAQLDGFVALGLGAAIALWTRPFLAGLCLGLTLIKPQLVLPLGVALLLTRHWRVLSGWAVAGVILLATSAALNPRWVLEWLPALGGTVQPGAREVDIAPPGTLSPPTYEGWAVVAVSLMALAAVLWLACRRGDDMRAGAAVLIAGGVLVAPHALPTDLVIVAVALAVWGEAKWQDWVLLSVGAAIAAVVPAPWPTVVGVLLVGWLCLRAAGLIAWRRGPARASAG